jgi:hypothetical protein
MAQSRDMSDAFDPMEALVESSLPLVFETYDAANKEGTREPVILLLDCQDEIGREIVEAWLGPETVEDAVLAIEAERDTATADEFDVTTVFARAMPLSACRKEVPAVFPYLAAAFDALPPDAILVMAVSAGGAATFIVPFASRP